MFPVADMRAAARKTIAQFEAVSSLPSITVLVGWDGTKILANLGAYRKVSREIPYERVTISRGCEEEEAATLFAMAVSRLQLALVGHTGRRSGKPPKMGHGWRKAMRGEMVARGGDEG